MKKISVIIPCYNVSRWIDRCMTSMADQTMGMEELEIICIDDASTDDTWERLQEWGRRYPENIRLIRQEVNQRQGTARNLGLRHASADWIAFVDADDWVETDYFEQLYGHAVKYGCDVACCENMRDNSKTLRYFDEEERRIRGTKSRFLAIDTKEGTKQLLRIRGTSTGAWALLVRKELLLKYKILFPENLVYEDRFWPPLLYLYVKRIYYAEERLYHYFSNPQSTVYSEDQSYLVDWMTVQLMKRQEYGRRGFLESYRDELDYDALCDAVKVMTLICRNEKPLFSLYQMERQLITQHVPDWKENPYFEDFEESSRCMLEALYLPLDREGFQEFRRTIRQMKQLLDSLKEKDV